MTFYLSQIKRQSRTRQAGLRERKSISAELAEQDALNSRKLLDNLASVRGSTQVNSRIAHVVEQTFLFSAQAFLVLVSW